MARARLILVAPEHLDQRVTRDSAGRKRQHREHRDLPASRVQPGEILAHLPLDALEREAAESDQAEVIRSLAVESVETRATDPATFDAHCSYLRFT